MAGETFLLGLYPTLQKFTPFSDYDYLSIGQIFFILCFSYFSFSVLLVIWSHEPGFIISL